MSDWRQQEENEQRRRREELYCCYCGKVIKDEGRAMCCGEVNQGESYDAAMRRWADYNEEHNHVND